MSESGDFPLRPSSSTGARSKCSGSQEQSSSSSKDGFKQRAFYPVRGPVRYFETDSERQRSSTVYLRKLPFKKNWSRIVSVGRERSRAPGSAQSTSTCDAEAGPSGMEAGPSGMEAGPSLAEVDSDDDDSSDVLAQELSKCSAGSPAANYMPMELQTHYLVSEVPRLIYPKKSVVQRFLVSEGRSPRLPRLIMNSANEQKTFATYHSVQINVGAEDSSRPRSAMNWNSAFEHSPSPAAVPVSEGAVAAEVAKSQEELLYEERMMTLVAELGLVSLCDSFNDLMTCSSGSRIDERRNLAKQRSAKVKDSLRIGDEICTLKPFLCMLYKAQIKNYCSYCFRQIQNIPRKCGSCGYLNYCDKVCQAWHLKMHARECRHYEKHSPHQPSDFQRMVILLICKLKTGDAENETSELINGRRYTYADLCPGLDTLDESYAGEHLLHSYNEIKSFLEDDMVTYEEYLIIFGKFFRNMVYITSPYREDIGVGLYLGILAFPQSCRPNANIVFEGVEAVLIACRDIKSRCTEQITFNRTRRVMHRISRLQTLKMHFNLTCNCAACEDRQFEKKLTEVLKPKKVEGPEGLKFKVAKLLAAFPLINPNYQHQILNLASGLLKVMAGVFGPMHVLRCLALEYACYACTFARDYDEIKFYYGELLKIYKFFYGLHHPKLVYALFRLAEAYFETGCIPEAQAMYICAVSNTLLTFGKRHSFSLGARETYKIVEKSGFDCRRFRR